MGYRVLSDFPETNDMFLEMENIFEIPIKSICLNKDDLNNTINTQACVFAVNVITWRVFVKYSNLKIDHFAGHSLGEYCALYAGNKIDFLSIANLVKKRAQIMSKYINGSMIAVFTGDIDYLKKICEIISKNPNHNIEIANYNSKTQYVISGYISGIKKMIRFLKKDKIKYISLKVCGAFHSSLMNEAKKHMKKIIEKIIIKKNKNKIFSNVTGDMHENYNLDLLINHMNQPVLWRQIIEKAYNIGIKNYIEIGPNKILSGLVRKILPNDVKILNTDNLYETLKKF